MEELGWGGMVEKMSCLGRVGAVGLKEVVLERME